MFSAGSQQSLWGASDGVVMLLLVAEQPAARIGKESVRLPLRGRREIMVIFYLTIPLMLVVIGLAVVPLLWVSIREQNSQRAMATEGSRRSALSGVAGSQITDVRTSFPDGFESAA